MHSKRGEGCWASCLRACARRLLRWRHREEAAAALESRRGKIIRTHTKIWGQHYFSEPKKSFNNVESYMTCKQICNSLSHHHHFTAASLMRAASRRLLPQSALPIILPPKPNAVPVCWAPSLPSHPFTSSRDTYIPKHTSSPLHSKNAYDARLNSTALQTLANEDFATSRGRLELCKEKSKAIRPHMTIYL